MIAFGRAAASLVAGVVATACGADGSRTTPSSHSSSPTSDIPIGPSTTAPSPPGAPEEPSSTDTRPPDNGAQTTNTEPSAPSPAPTAPSSAADEPAADEPAADDSSAPPNSSGGSPTDSERAPSPAAESSPDGGSSPANQAPTPPPSPDAGAAPLSFAADIWPIYQMTREPPFVYPGGTTYGSCVVGGVCHGGERPGAGLHMPDAQTAYQMLLEVPSQSSLCQGTLRVVAEHPEESCLILFYEGRLHDELDWVDDAEIDLMRHWIAQGALP